MRFPLRTTRRAFTTALLALMLATGCATAPAETAGETRATKKSSPRRLELGVRTTNGQWLELGALRGKPLLVFVFATFDAVSQAALKPLRRFVQNGAEIQIVGVAAQPRASQLVSAWAYALDPPFVVGTDPYGRVEEGLTALGKIETVPTYIVYDAAGYERERVTGMQSEKELIELARLVGSPGPSAR